MAEPYKRRVSYTFEFRHHTNWEITEWSETRMEFEDMRKNGQEDTHISGDVVKVDGVWAWKGNVGEYSSPPYFDGGVQIVECWGEEMASGLLAYFNEHGAPPAEVTGQD